MGDIAIEWSNGILDLAAQSEDLSSDEGLRTAVLLSLFIDRRAEDDDTPPSMDDGDRRGWWADELLSADGDRIGSRLWLLDRTKRTEDVARRAEELAREALAWMLTDRVASKIDIGVETSEDALHLAITLHRPSGDPVAFRFAHTWASESRRNEAALS